MEADHSWPPEFRVHFVLEKQLHPRVSIERTQKSAQLPAKLGLRFLTWSVCTSVCTSRNRMKRSESVGSEYLV